MSALRFLPVTALLLASGCAYDSEAQGYDPGYPSAPYDQSYPPSGAYDQGVPFGEANVPSTEVFYDQLAPYGRWIDSRYGRAWQPRVGRDWRPYTLGRWGEGRYWISDEPFGWATYHYGRWAFDPNAGWLWLPGTEWAPSWVAWRDADDYSGWAPLPPGLSVSVGLGFGYGYDRYDSWYQPSWVWVPRNYLYQPRFGGHIADYRIGFRIWDRSRWQQRPEWHGRPGGGQSGNGRPGWNGQQRGSNRPGWNGRPDQQRPDQQRPDQQRPDNNRPGWNGQQQGGNRPNWNGQRPDGQRPDGPRPDGQRPGWNGRQTVAVAPQPGVVTPQPGNPYAGSRPGRPADQTQPVYQRPAPQGGNSGWQGRPDRSPNMGGGQPGATIQVPQVQQRPAFVPPPQAARPAPPPAQAERPAPPPREERAPQRERRNPDEKPQ